MISLKIGRRPTMNWIDWCHENFLNNQVGVFTIHLKDRRVLKGIPRASRGASLCPLGEDFLIVLHAESAARELFAEPITSFMASEVRGAEASNRDEGNK